MSIPLTLEIWALALIPALILFAAAGYEVRRKKRVLRDWPLVEAEVISADLVTLKGLQGGRGRVYAPKIAFRFHWRGKRVETVWQQGWSSSGAASNRQLIASLPPGSRQEVRVNPANPAKIEFSKGAALFGGAMIIAAVGLLYLIVALCVLLSNDFT